MTGCLLCHRPAQKPCVPLCGDCRADLHRTLSSAPALYVRGAQAQPAVSHALSDKLSTPKPGSRPPGGSVLPETCDLLARRLTGWETHTTHITGTTVTPAPVRPGYAVQRAATTITTHLSAALTPPGVDHARVVLATAATLRHLLRLDVLVHQLAAPCPHCDTRALTRRDGDDHVSCRVCRSSWPEQHYAFLVRLQTADTPPTPAVTDK